MATLSVLPHPIRRKDLFWHLCFATDFITPWSHRNASMMVDRGPNAANHETYCEWPVPKEGHAIAQVHHGTNFSFQVFSLFKNNVHKCDISCVIFRSVASLRHLQISCVIFSMTANIEVVTFLTRESPVSHAVCQWVEEGGTWIHAVA